MRNLITAAVRTAVVSAVTLLVAWLAGVGIEVDPTALELTLTAIAIGVVNLALNWLQTKLPWLGTIMSLGLSNDTPSYS